MESVPQETAAIAWVKSHSSDSETFEGRIKDHHDLTNAILSSAPSSVNFVVCVVLVCIQMSLRKTKRILSRANEQVLMELKIVLHCNLKVSVVDF